MAERVRVREIDDDEGQRLLRIVRRSSGSVVTWRRAQMILLSAQGMDPVKIAQVSFTSVDRVRDVIHNFNADGFDLHRLLIVVRTALGLASQQLNLLDPVTRSLVARRVPPS